MAVGAWKPSVNVATNGRNGRSFVGMVSPSALTTSDLLKSFTADDAGGQNVSRVEVAGSSTIVRESVVASARVGCAATVRAPGMRMLRVW